MRILISTTGSHGDVLPFIGLGREFTRRGHEVICLSNPHFRSAIEGAGLGFRPIGSEAGYQALIGVPPQATPRQAFAAAADHLAAAWADELPALREAVRPGETICIGGSLMMGHRLLGETLGLPCATVHLAPSVLRSSARPARLVPRGWITAASPAWQKRLAWWLLDVGFYEPYFTRRLNHLRAGLGLAPLKRIFAGWLHEADCVLGLFPPWFAAPAPDWPAQVQLSGFALEDLQADPAQALPADLQDFLAEGSGAPVVAFSAGTATATARDFYAASIRACELAGLRGLLLSTVDAQIPPQSLPPGIRHVRYAPFGTLLPRLAALVHHGGIGSTAQALRAGVPQLIRPLAYDQFDNSARTVALGAGLEVLAPDYRPEPVARLLTQLTSDPARQARCQELARQLKADPGLGASCELILARLAPEGRPRARPVAA